ncbi:MAG: alpha/beta fold hydrolase [Rhodocyclaceae bacterium]|nr:alpha/beta fold hydrolase [Rhodocyclaceae bacterium]
MHGLTMSLLAHRIRHRGFRTITYSYPSVRLGLDDNARRLRDFLVAQGEPGFHLVGHSLGGVIILRMLATLPHPPVHRVVLLGSPLQGSALARQLCQRPLMAHIIGRSMGAWLGPAPCAAPSGCEVAVIAGTRCLAAARIFGGVARPNDGVVALSETRLDGETDRCVLHVGHSEMLLSRRVAGAAADFLARGRFAAPESGSGRQ